MPFQSVSKKRVVKCRPVPSADISCSSPSARWVSKVQKGQGAAWPWRAS